MLEYIAHNGIAIREEQHAIRSPVRCVLFVESGDTEFNPGFRINVNGDSPIRISGTFEKLEDIVGDYQPRPGGGETQQDVKDILHELEWLGNAYIYEGSMKFPTPRLLLTSHTTVVENNPLKPLWREIPMYKLKEILNMFYSTPAETPKWK